MMRPRLLCFHIDSLEIKELFNCYIMFVIFSGMKCDPTGAFVPPSVAMPSWWCIIITCVTDTTVMELKQCLKPNNMIN